MQQLIDLSEASRWASGHLGKTVTAANIAYLIQYGRIAKHVTAGNTIAVDKNELARYYQHRQHNNIAHWKKQLGDDLNWKLSFSQYKEAETTKHVHRLHPYKGKFIPQLVEYFLDDRTDEFKRQIFFNRGDIILDPFCGSGTTLIQANELGMHAVGVDVSAFNAFISNVKLGAYDVADLMQSVVNITRGLRQFQQRRNNLVFERELSAALKEFNLKYFPSPAYKYKVNRNEINEKTYSAQMQEKFLPTYNALVKKHRIDLSIGTNGSFLQRWFIKTILDEIDFVFDRIKQHPNLRAKKMLALILSRTVRSCRATTHADLATLKNVVTTAYYCRKHAKICKPLFSIASWWQRYATDAVARIQQFNKVRTNTLQCCLVGDSREIDIFAAMNKQSASFGKLLRQQKIAGIFSSPPYVGLIDYHEQHAYAYDLFGYTRNDELEIGALFNGQGAAAKKSYVEGVARVLLNCKKYLKEDYNALLVANDKHNLYADIAELARMKIVNRYKRPVLNRVEKSRGAYAEIIFHLREK